MAGREDIIQQYLKETIQALLPVYDQGGSGTLVYTCKGEFRDKRALPWLVNRLAHYFSLDLAVLRKRSGALLGQRHHLSLPLSPDLVLLPVRVRKAALQGETTIAYINLPQIDHFTETAESPPYRSAIVFQGGRIVESMHGIATLRERARQGEQVREDFLCRNKNAVAERGLDSSELFSVLPDCRCLLKDLFVKFFSSAERSENHW